MKKYDIDLWVQNLEAIYQQALNAKPVKPFFLCIYDYVNYIITTDKLAQLSDVFYVEKKADYEALDQYKKELIDYIQSVIPKLEKYESINQVEKNEIKDILSIRKGTLQVLGDPEGWTSIFEHIDDIAINAVRHKEVDRKIFKILEIDEYNNEKVTKWKMYDVYRDYKEEEAKMERLQETRNWWSWNRLRLFYEMYDNKEGIRKDIVKSKGWFQSTNLIYLEDEIKAIAKNVTYDQMRVFTCDNYLMYLQKAHRQLLNEIAQFGNLLKNEDEDIKEDNKSRVPFYFDENKTIILIKDKEIKFKKDTKKMALLKYLMKKSKEIYYAEAVEVIEGAVTDEENTNIKNIYYEACRGIEISFAKKGITDFLIYDFNQAKINPKYKLEK